MRKALSVLIAGCLVLSLCCGGFAPVPKARAAEEDGYVYVLVGVAPNQTARITGYNGVDTDPLMPWTLGGCPVTSTGTSAFSGKTTLVSVIIGSGVTSMGNSAFYGCTELAAAYFLGDAPAIGTDVFFLCASTLTLWYIDGKAAWLFPLWHGYHTNTMFVLTYTAGAHGSISGTTPQTVCHGASGTAVTALADTGYHFAQWTGGSSANPRTDTNVTADHTFTATFAIDPLSLTLTSPNGSESWAPASVQSVTWTVAGDTSAIRHFSLYYSVDGGNSWERVRTAGGAVAYPAPADRTFAWTVPDRFSSRAKVIIYAMNAASQLLAYDASDAFFTIAPGAGTLPGVSLIHPSAESWGAGTTQEIT